MSKLNQIFNNIPELSPSSKMEGSILRKIGLLEANKVKMARVVSFVGFVGSVTVFAYAMITFGGSILQSEFWSVISLVFSDSKIVLSNWQEFSFSVLETFPVVGTIAMLVPTVVLLWSVSLYLSLSLRGSSASERTVAISGFNA